MKTYKTPFESRIAKLLVGPGTSVRAGQSIAILKPLRFQGMDLPPELAPEVSIEAPIGGHVIYYPGIAQETVVASGQGRCPIPC